MQIPDWLQRVITERDDLKVKIDALSNYLLSEQLKLLDQPVKDLLHAQYFSMSTYYSILNIRVQLHTGNLLSDQVNESK